MNPVRLAFVLSLLGAASANAATVPGDLTIGDAYSCRQTFANYGPTGIPSWVVADRGTLTLNVEHETYQPTSYDYHACFLTDQEAPNGGWSWNGTATFDSGPLARPDEGWSVAGHWFQGRTAMPHDDIRGRTSPLVLRSLTAKPAEEAPATDGQEGKDGYQHSYWYCGPLGAAPRKVFGKKAIGYVQHTSGIKVQLPTWVEPTQYESYKPGVRGRIRVAKRGLFRLEFLPRGCSRSCPSVAIFSAKRAPASELGNRTAVTLANGITGYAGSVGCSASDGSDWGPVYCGRNVIVWHAKGINHAIETPSADVVDLVRYANQAIRHG